MQVKNTPYSKMAAILVFFTCKLALVASFLNLKFKRIFSLKQGNRG